MDGVIYRGKLLIDGAVEFIKRLNASETRYLFLTNNSEQTPLDLKRKLEALGIKGLSESNFITSAMATASFLSTQCPGGTLYVIGGGGLISELYNAGFSISDNKPDYVVVGKTNSFNFDMLKSHIIDNERSKIYRHQSGCNRSSRQWIRTCLWKHTGSHRGSHRRNLISSGNLIP